MPKAIENLILFLFGGAIYSIIEVVFRGYTHWSMTLTGGLCLLIMYRRFTARPQEPLLMKCLFGAIVITALEFIAGCIVNLWLGWNVWDYSGLIFNLFGQICLPFSVIWFFITIPAAALSKFLSGRFADIRLAEIQQDVIQQDVIQQDVGEAQTIVTETRSIVTEL